jgi:hypothetical protein
VRGEDVEAALSEAGPVLFSPRAPRESVVAAPPDWAGAAHGHSLVLLSQRIRAETPAALPPEAGPTLRGQAAPLVPLCIAGTWNFEDTWLTRYGRAVYLRPINRTLLFDVPMEVGAVPSHPCPFSHPFSAPLRGSVPLRGMRGSASPPPPLPLPPSHTKWTHLVHPSVLIGHVSSFSARRSGAAACRPPQASGTRGAPPWRPPAFFTPPQGETLMPPPGAARVTAKQSSSESEIRRLAGATMTRPRRSWRRSRCLPRRAPAPRRAAPHEPTRRAG